MSDHQLASRVARELSSPEPGMHFGITLVVGTVVAAPVLGAALFGRQSVPTALAIYAATLVVVWVLAGLLGGALALAGRGRSVDEAGAMPEDQARPGTAASSPSPQGSPPAHSESVGSDGAH
ncbi:MAG: hypothetical protein U5K29_10300 [Acidimicrobiales bacterium]|nr:hypothetical protein [Acidimicrobiales bacterium]